MRPRSPARAQVESLGGRAQRALADRDAASRELRVALDTVHLFARRNAALMRATQTMVRLPSDELVQGAGGR